MLPLGKVMTREAAKYPVDKSEAVGMAVTTDLAADLWSSLLSRLKVLVTPPAYETIAGSSRPLGLEGEVLTVEVGNAFTKNYLTEKFAPAFRQALVELGRPRLALAWQVGSQRTTERVAPAAASGRPAAPLSENWAAKSLRSANLNPRYTFNNFVVGPSNRFAQAASLAVADNPAKTYNPFFIYGGVGLGKTHLMQAIGHRLLERQPTAKVLYASAEKFTNEFISAIQSGATAAFQARYRQVDLLLLDDIQFFVGKEKTQEEFFHTFNALFDRSKQIVITSDRPPRETTAFHDRLRSRFEAGLVADIKPPELETRIAILRCKADADSNRVGNEVLEFIAEQTPSNIRELEGALVRVSAFARLTGGSVNLSLAEEVLKDTLPKHREKVVTIHQIKKVVAAHFDISPDALSGPSRTQDVALARHIAMYLSRSLSGLSLPRIGENFGGRDHSTVLHGCRRVTDLMAADERTENLVKSFLGQLRQI